MVVWTGVVAWAYDGPRRRRAPLFVADILVAMAALVSTPFVQSAEMLARHASTLPSFWVMPPVLAWAIWRGWGVGLLAALAMSGVDLAARTDRTGPTWGNIFLLFLAAGIVGYAGTLLREAVEARAEAERSAAAVEERARLARVVHDGVLQVLALVQRRGLELGGEAAELGRLAGEQEIALRTLVQTSAARPGTSLPAESGSGDLMPALDALQTSAVTVTGPATPVRLPVRVVDELTAVVAACLDNVARHVGPQAPAWVLVEDIGDAVLVSVRDQGPGIAPGRLEAARAEGRLGVSQSIQGRMAELGGTASLITAPGLGTEWELSTPRAR
jgi:signal transduction histidine kinase